MVVSLTGRNILKNVISFLCSILLAPMRKRNQLKNPDRYRNIESVLILLDDVIGQMHPWYKDLEHTTPEEQMRLGHAYGLVLDELGPAKPGKSSGWQVDYLGQYLSHRSLDESGLLRAKQCYEKMCLNRGPQNTPYRQKPTVLH